MRLLYGFCHECVSELSSDGQELLCSTMPQLQRACWVLGTVYPQSDMDMCAVWYMHSRNVFILYFVNLGVDNTVLDAILYTTVR